MLGVGLHLIVAILAIIAHLQWWLVLLVIISVVSSWAITLKQYKAVTSSEGDLCWTGENWSIAGGKESNAIHYLELKSTSWVTNHFSLLKFTSGAEEKSWLFTHKHLGERTYRELCYLIRQDFHLSGKNRD